MGKLVLKRLPFQLLYNVALSMDNSGVDAEYSISPVVSCKIMNGIFLSRGSSSSQVREIQTAKQIISL